MNKFIFLLFLLTMISCGGNNLKDDSYGTEVLSELRWDEKDFPVTLNVPNDLMDKAEQIEAAVNVWNDVFNEEVIILNYSSSSSINFNSVDEISNLTENYIYSQSTWEIRENGELIPQNLAINLTIAVEGKIRNSSILFNEFSYDFTDSETSPHYQSYDFQSVLIHELGHFLGLKHTTDYDDVMFPSIPANTNRRILSPNDINNLKELYNIE